MKDPGSTRELAVVSTEELIREFMGRDVGNLLRFDSRARRGNDIEGVHQLRVNARRLRAELRVVAPVIKKRSYALMRSELRWIGKVSGPLRDVDVLEGVLRSLPNSSDCPSYLLSPLTRRRELARCRISRAMRSGRYLRLMITLSRAVISPPFRVGAHSPADTVVVPRLRRALRELFAAASALGSSPSNDQLHKLRVQVKHCRYACEVAGALVEGAAGAAKEFEAVQGILGTLHDHVVTLDYLRDTATSSSPRSPNDELVRDATMRAITNVIDEQRLLWTVPFEQALAAVTPLVGQKDGTTQRR